ncbi:hypothetical protein NDU88_000790 [Pleurodeles waltl]|uniref:Uncharacterized protein n=1 Tax=Pleurodeles waltl TaxID=8319 RepID=A0AAV7WKH1_PLEWA|nr:hypothetical protein NDU88_000790 [Pleurodeles waltl]
MGLGDIRSEHERLGLHVPSEVTEKIWKGAYVDIFDLLVDKSDKEVVKLQLTLLSELHSGGGRRTAAAQTSRTVGHHLYYSGPGEVELKGIALQGPACITCAHPATAAQPPKPAPQLQLSWLRMDQEHTPAACGCHFQKCSTPWPLDHIKLDQGGG